MTEAVGRVAQLWRYPVKSLGGERLERVRVERRGLAGDRSWAVLDPDGKLGSGKSSRRFRAMPGLLELRAFYAADGQDPPFVELPDGRRLRGDDPEVHEALSAHVGRPVTLGPERSVSHFDEGPVHLVTTATIAALARAHGDHVPVPRLRPSLVVDTGAATGFVEDAWVGRRVRVGPEVVLSIRGGMPRCVMVTQAQRELPPDTGLLHTATRVNAGIVGVVADVVTPGEVGLDDEVRLEA